MFTLILLCHIQKEKDAASSSISKRRTHKRIQKDSNMTHLYSNKPLLLLIIIFHALFHFQWESCPFSVPRPYKTPEYFSGDPPKKLSFNFKKVQLVSKLSEPAWWEMPTLSTSNSSASLSINEIDRQRVKLMRDCFGCYTIRYHIQIIQSTIFGYIINIRFLVKKLHTLQNTLHTLRNKSLKDRNKRKKKNRVFMKWTFKDLRSLEVYIWSLHTHM